MFTLEFGNVPTVWYFLGEMFPTVWYFLGEMFRQCGIFWGNVPTVSVVFFAFHFIICTEQDKIYCLYFVRFRLIII